jgi:hypothetical protein
MAVVVKAREGGAEEGEEGGKEDREVHTRVSRKPPEMLTCTKGVVEAGASSTPPALNPSLGPSLSLG